MATMSFLTPLPPRYAATRSQILSGAEIPSLEKAFSCVLRTKQNPSSAPITPTSALLSRGHNDNQGPRNRSGSKAGGTNQEPKEVICYYCKEQGHTKPGYAQLKSTNPPVSTAIATGNEATALVSSSSKWIIDSSATNHMIGNRHLFSNHNSHDNPSNITITDGSHSRVLGSGTFNKAVEACRITKNSFNHHLMVKTTPGVEKGGQGGQGVTSSNMNKKRKQPWNNRKNKKGDKAPKGKECPKCGKNHSDRPCMAGQNVCYTCGKPGHFSRECPQNTEQARPYTQGRVFAIIREEAQKSPKMIQGTIMIDNSLVQVEVEEGIGEIPVVREFPKVFPI
ncbi:uncharacterized protein LOC114755371 [Neltuma alba]|uniref:uncharacterized protein LOC114755371 n=1 Tax=Neltuma alba TaxID=207710 RepID=UPI0010A3AEB7|nr:uncharacterized protein LOC114755371 [Prosopis alba]